MKECLSCPVYEKCIASVLTEEEGANFGKVVTLKEVKANRVIYKEKNYAGNIYMLVHGGVKLELKNSIEQPIIMRIAQGGEAIGLESVFSNYNYFMTATSLNVVKLCVISKAFLMKAIGSNHLVCAMLINEIQKSQEMTSQHYLSMISGKSEAKLARALILLCDKYGELRVTREEIALMTGLTRETVSRILSKMKSKKVIEIIHRTIIISNMNELNKLTIHVRD